MRSTLLSTWVCQQHRHSEVRVKGTVWPVIITKLVVVTLYVVLAYMFALAYSFNFGSVGKTILSSTMSFLLIFRANQAYTRYAIGRSTLTSFFTHVREFIMCSMGYIRGSFFEQSGMFGGRKKVAVAEMCCIGTRTIGACEGV